MAERLFQVGIKALITNDLGHILLLQSIARDGSERWDLPGGRMDENETFHQTLSRELQEEIGTNYTGKPVFLNSVLANVALMAGDKEVGLILNIYRTTIPPETVIQLNDYETAYEWVTPKEAAKRIANKYPAEFTQTVETL